MKFNKIINLIVIFVFIFCIPIFASKKKEELVEPQKDFYSKQILSENINDGVKVSLIKSDKFGNDQDEFTSVDITVENLNMYADLEFKIEAVGHDEFKTNGSKTKSMIVSSNDENDTYFDYTFKNPTRKYIPKDEKSKYSLEHHFKGATDSNISSYSNMSDRERRDRIENQDEYISDNEAKENKVKNKVWIIAIVLIAVFVMCILIIFIYKYIKNNDSYYNLFLIIGISIIITLCTILNNKVYAYSQQAFMYGTEYSHVYTVEVYHQGRAYNFRFRVTYKFLGDEPNIDANIDTDCDGLTDIKEIYFMCDLNNQDTDGDGISDFDEIYTIDTDPLKVDTNNNGKLDGDEDYDGDLLSNIYELSIGTYMDNIDTDGDGLSDYDEIKVYNTDPLNVDSDNDGVSDYEEVEIAKRLGISDIHSINKNTKIEQELTRDNFDSALYKENVIGMKVSGDTYGLIENHVKVKSKSNAALDNINSILGKVAYIDSDYDNVDLNVTFDITNYNLKKEQLRICIYENGKVKLLNTTLDGDNITATTKKGYCFVIDLNRYVDTILGYKKDNWK